MRKTLHKLNDIFSWVLLFGTAILLVFSLITASNSAKSGEGAFLFGYRPIFVMTGSMEPYMMTNSLCLTEKVESLDEIAVGDVITFHLEDSNGKRLNITHRIVSIDDGIINTKGDNNSVTDDLGLTIENVDSKVIFVMNQTAWLIAQWQTTSGKIMLISFGLALVFVYLMLKMLISYLKEKKKGAPAEGAEEELSADTIDAPPASASDAPEAPETDEALAEPSEEP